jgi:hypothetical protein
MNRVLVVGFSLAMLMSTSVFADNSKSTVSSDVTLGNVVRIPSRNQNDSDNIYVYPISVKGVDCVVVSGGQKLDAMGSGSEGNATTVAVTCDWNHNPNKPNH